MFSRQIEMIERVLDNVREPLDGFFLATMGRPVGSLHEPISSPAAALSSPSSNAKVERGSCPLLLQHAIQLTGRNWASRSPSTANQVRPATRKSTMPSAYCH
jgi:hypothetical protein